MKRTYWYKVRRVSVLEHGSVMGWQTEYDQDYVLERLKKSYGDRLAIVYYEDENCEQVPIYSNL